MIYSFSVCQNQGNKSMDRETIVTARVPIAQFRRTHCQRGLHMSRYKDLFNADPERYPPNLFTPYQPKEGQDAYTDIRFIVR